MQPIINSQISELKESATLSINQHAIKLLNEGKKICHLGFGESPFPVPAPMQIALRENAYRKQYISGRGLPELRKAVADFFKTQFGYTFEGPTPKFCQSINFIRNNNHSVFSANFR